MKTNRGLTEKQKALVKVSIAYILFISALAVIFWHRIMQAPIIFIPPAIVAIVAALWAGDR